MNKTAQCGTSCFKKAHLFFCAVATGQIGTAWWNKKVLDYNKHDLALNKTFKTVMAE